ncbi:hypothetical protein BT93_D1306 [Corymbia citriodora subsp. variegata]|nr:hypothetical protein BT93_D1306 [Corymbia citriodora subsp. variegata]
MVRVFIDQAKALHQHDAYKELLRKLNSDKDTLLHSAIRGGCKRVVELLIEEDPQLCDITNAADESPLYLAAHRRCSDIIELILRASSSPSSHKGPKGLTALHAAVQHSLPGWEKLLEKSPEVIREGDAVGWSPLHYRAYFGEVEAVQLLLQHDNSVAYVLDKNGDSALHIAALEGHINVINELITSCPDAWDIINTKRQTALHASVIGGRVNVVKHILRMPNREDLINERDADGNTALHLAVLLKKIGVAFILAEDKRVDQFVTNKKHLTALDILDAFDEMRLSMIRLRWSLKKSNGSPRMQDWVMERVKERLDQQNFEGQPAASTTIGSDSPLKSVIDLELLVAAFIATATFAAAFTMPGGYSNDGPNQGMATLADRAAFKFFVITNTIAFSFSTMALFMQYDAVALSDHEKARFTSRTSAFIYIAMLGMVLAFASGTYVVLTRTIGLAIVPWVICGFLGINYIRGLSYDSDSRFKLLRMKPRDFLPKTWR